MKKAILTVLTILMLVIPAYAAEGDPATDQSIQQEQEPVVVATLDELQAAIDTAEDGRNRPYKPPLLMAGLRTVQSLTLMP